MRKIKFLRYFAIIDRITKNGVRKPLFCPSSDYEQQQKKKRSHTQQKSLNAGFFLSYTLATSPIGHCQLTS